MTQSADISVIEDGSRMQLIEKSIRNLNSQFSLLRDFVTFVGSSHSDSSVIREEIVRLRTSIRECAMNVEKEFSLNMSSTTGIGTTVMSGVNNNNSSAYGNISNVSGAIGGKTNRTFLSHANAFLTCLELIISELRKMRYLHESFPHVNCYDENQSTVLGTLVLRHACSSSAKVQNKTAPIIDNLQVDSDIKYLMQVKSRVGNGLKCIMINSDNSMQTVSRNNSASVQSVQDIIIPPTTKRKMDNFRLSCLCCRIFSPSYI